MKLRLVKLLVAAMAAFTVAVPLGCITGCATFNQNHVAAAQQAALTITRELLIAHPDWRPKFDKARVELAELEKLDVVSASHITAIISRLPAALESPSARVAFDGVNIIIIVAGNPTASASTSDQLKQVAAGLGRGMDAAFAQLPAR